MQMEQSASPIGSAHANTNVMVESLELPYNRTIQEALGRHEYNFVICDPRLPDHPIVYASEGFLKMTGYRAQEVLGRNCRFLQGPETERRTVLEIRDAIREERSCQVRILNYTKQRKPFWNLFHLAPVYSRENGMVVHYVGVQTPLSDKAADVDVVSDSLLESGSKVASDNENNGGLDADVQKNGDIVADDLDALNSQLRGGGMDSEDKIEVQEKDERRATTAVRSVLSELTKSSKSKGGIAEQRCMSLAESASVGVVCSSLMLSLTRIQQSFVL